MDVEAKEVDLSTLRIERPSGEFGPSPPWARWLKRIAVALLLLLAVSVGYLWLRGKLRPAVKVQLVAASLVSPAQAEAVLTASGYVVASRKAAVASKGTGQLVYLGVEEGDSVKKGQVLARLEDSDVAAVLEQAKHNLRVSEADLKDAQRSLARQKTLLERELVAQADYDTAEARYMRVVASIAAAKAAVAEAEAAVENTRILAPFDGTVLEKNANVGEIVAPLAGAANSRAAVVTIADMRSLEIEADVAESNITRVFSDQPCEITLDAYPEQRYQGYVSKIVPTADRAKATVMVKIKFSSYDERVLPEMSAKIAFLSRKRDISAEEGKAFVAVPATSVASRNGRQVVYQVREERAVEVPVVAGRRLDGMVEIKEGLKVGERVIARVDDKIRAGAKVSTEGQ